MYGVDIAESQIKKAEEYLSECNNVSLAVTKNNVLPFDDNMFEMSITYGCFSAVKKGDLPFFYKEIERTTQKVGVFIEYFPTYPPARSAVQVSALPMGVRIEIEAVGTIE